MLISVCFDSNCFLELCLGPNVADRGCHVANLCGCLPRRSLKESLIEVFATFPEW